jgi:prepilin-type processing-associated H-X9-DG protein
VLIALLLPTLRKARETAKTVACASNLRQVGIALTMYQNSNRGWLYPVMTLPGSDEPVARGGNVPPDERWPVYVFKITATPTPPYDPYEYLEAFTPPVLRCPADLNPAFAHSYVLNQHLVRHQIKANSKNLGGRTISEVVLAGEKWENQMDYYMGVTDYDRVVDTYKHGLRVGSNHLFLDGHVSTSYNPAEMKGAIDPWDTPGAGQPGAGQ